MTPVNQDRWVFVAQLVGAIVLILLGGCLAAFTDLGGNASGGTPAIPLAIIGAGAALLPGGAAASARILQALPSSATPDLAEIQLNPDSGAAGRPVTGAVTLTSPAPVGGFTAALAVDKPDAGALSSSSLTVPAGSSVAQFTLNPSGASGTKVTVTATAGSTSKSAVFAVA